MVHPTVDGSEMLLCDYSFISAFLFLDKACGTSMDWAKGEAGIKYAFTVELPDRGYYGFLLPASSIKAVGEEVTAGLTAAVLEMARLEGHSSES